MNKKRGKNWTSLVKAKVKQQSLSCEKKTLFPLKQITNNNALYDNIKHINVSYADTVIPK